MQNNVFPPVYKVQLDAACQSKINDERNKSKNREEQISKQRRDKLKNTGLSFGIVIGMIGGFCVCIVKTDSDIDNSGKGLISWVVFIVIAVIMGMIIDKIAEHSWKNNEKGVAAQIADEKNNLENRIKDIREQEGKEYQQYIKEFEDNSQKMSVQFADSELAREVIEWMTDGFFRTIDSADRRSHVEQINVPFVFNVFYNKITCNLGTYDFEMKRCRNLNNPIEQNALARAIASAIQLNIIMKYPKDESGTDISINIIYEYTNEYSVTSITYVAPNGNFKSVRGW
jgi:hypothetical protein